jgi:outer membrane biosynthesis protein TonB
MTVPRRSASSGNSPSALNLVAQKSAKKKAKKSGKSASDTGVLGNLRTTRPSRIGGLRRAEETTTPPATATEPPAAKPAKAPKPKPAKAAKPKPAKAAKPKPAKAAKPGKATVKPTKRVAPAPKPAPERIPPPESGGRPSGTEIVTTAVQAAGELAQIGATVGGQLLRRAARRIPRP